MKVGNVESSHLFRATVFSLTRHDKVQGESDIPHTSVRPDTPKPREFVHHSTQLLRACT